MCNLDAKHVGRALLLLTAALGMVAHGATVLDAVKRNDGAGLRTLLADRADPNDADADGTTALHWAVHQGESEVAAALLNAGATVDAPNRYGVRPLYLAAENGDTSMTHALLEAGANPNGMRVEGETVLMTAARTGNVATLEALIAAGADVDAVEERGDQGDRCGEDRPRRSRNRRRHEKHQNRSERCDLVCGAKP